MLQGDQVSYVFFIKHVTVRQPRVSSLFPETDAETGAKDGLGWEERLHLRGDTPEERGMHEPLVLLLYWDCAYEYRAAGSDARKSSVESETVWRGDADGVSWCRGLPYHVGRLAVLQHRVRMDAWADGHGQV